MNLLMDSKNSGADLESNRNTSIRNVIVFRSILVIYPEKQIHLQSQLNKDNLFIVWFFSERIDGNNLRYQLPHCISFESCQMFR
jgi:hypothetical protein